jgi:hypothetical protein
MLCRVVKALKEMKGNPLPPLEELKLEGESASLDVR